MKLIILTGSEAVGKMTVGQELSKLTGYKLFHEHMVKEPVLELFDCPDKSIIKKYQKCILEEFSKDKTRKGIILTRRMNFKDPEELEELKEFISLFQENDPDLEVFMVNLKAPFSIRLNRNATPNRLKYKPSKRDTKASEKELRRLKGKYTVNQKILENIIYKMVEPGHFIQIDNTVMKPDLAAMFICHFFQINTFS